MSNQKCCVPGCVNNSGNKETLHKFPHPIKHKEMFNTWLYSVGGPLLALENDQIFKYRRVCHIHFEEKYCCRNQRLSNIAVPTKNLPGLQQSIKSIVQTDHCYIRNRVLPEGSAVAFPIPSGSSASTLTVNEKDTQYTRTKLNADAPAEKKEEKKLGKNLKEDGNLGYQIPSDTFECDDLPASLEEDFTTDIVSDIGDAIQVDDSNRDNIFSWQKTELIEADDSDNSKAVPVPEPPKIPEDLTLSMFCESDEPPDLPPPPSELVAVVPEDVDHKCKDCETIVDGFSWWCVQCGRGAMCGACALRAPHDAHYVLRAPPSATHNQSQTLMAVIRQQLLKENLLPLYEILDDGVKVEIKEEPEERPVSPQPAATPDPLGDPLGPTGSEPDTNLTVFYSGTSSPGPSSELNEEHLEDDFFDESDASCAEESWLEPSDECLIEETIEHHPFKRPKLMDTQSIKKSMVTTQNVRRCPSKVPTNNPSELQTVQTAARDIGISENLVQAAESESNSTQYVLTVNSSNPVGSQTLVPITLSDLKKLHTFLRTTASDPKITKDMLNTITNDLQAIETILISPNETQTEVQVTSSDPTEPETLEIVPSNSNRLQDLPTTTYTDSQIDPDDLRLQDVLQGTTIYHTSSETALKVYPKNQNELKTAVQSDRNDVIASKTRQPDSDNLTRLQDTTSFRKPVESQTVLTLDSGKLADALQAKNPGNRTRSKYLKFPYRNYTASQLLQKITHSDRTRLQSLQKVTLSDRLGSQNLAKVTPGDRMLPRTTPNIIRRRDASQFLRKVVPINLTTPCQFQPNKLNIEKFLNISKGTLVSPQQNPKGSKPQEPQKVTSEPNLTKFINVDDDIDTENSNSKVMVEKIQDISKGALLSLQQNPNGSESQIVLNSKYILTNANSEPKSAEATIINLDTDAEDIEFLEEEYLDTDIECRISNEAKHTDIDSVRNIESEEDNDYNKGKDEKYRMLEENTREGQVENRNSTETRTEADSELDSDKDDSDLDKDYRIGEDSIADDSIDETDVEDAAGGVCRSTRNTAKRKKEPENGPSEAILKMVTSKAIVQLEPLNSAVLKKWTTNKKRRRKD